MTFYTPMSGSFLSTAEEQAEYFLADCRYVLDVSAAIMMDTQDLDRVSERAAEKMRTGQDLSPPEARTVGTMFVGDAEWHNPWCTWVRNDLWRWAAMFTNGPIHHKWLAIAKKYYDISRLQMPGYSAPEDFLIAGEPARDCVKNAKDAIALKTSILQVDWYTYVCDQLSIAYDEDLMRRSQQECAEYFTNNRETLTTEVRQVQQALFTADLEWFHSIAYDLGARSYFSTRVQKALKQALEDDLSTHTS